MQDIIFMSLLGLVFVSTIILCITIHGMNAKITDITKTLGHQYNLLGKIQATLKNKNATNAVAENAEIIYQDLLQNLIPIMAAIDAMPRNTNEHPLWRALGGIMDEYSRNPFALEKLRRCIKLDSNISQNVTNYMARANRLLQYLTTTEPDGILASTFTDGLLGQSLTFFGQAQQLADTGDSN
ncbi:MAG: hypothetical protein ACLRFM_04340 [Alphaproteobacteria bacterium]